MRRLQRCRAAPRASGDGAARNGHSEREPSGAGRVGVHARRIQAACHWSGLSSRASSHSRTMRSACGRTTVDPRAQRSSRQRGGTKRLLPTRLADEPCVCPNHSTADAGKGCRVDPKTHRRDGLASDNSTPVRPRRAACAHKLSQPKPSSRSLARRGQHAWNAAAPAPRLPKRVGRRLGLTIIEQLQRRVYRIDCMKGGGGASGEGRWN